MNLSTAPALLLGLGARILLDQVTRVTDEPPLQSTILQGAWQGVALSYATKEHDFAVPVGCAIVAKLYLEFAFYQDTSKSVISLLGVVLGYFAADLLSGLFDQPKEKKPPSSSTKEPTATGPTSAKRERERERDRDRDRSHRRRTSDGETRTTSSRKSKTHSSRYTTSDITEVNTDSELVPPKDAVSPIDRQVAALRARASLADSERRRFKEEKKWAVAQGNMELAAELSWQYKRYSTLMKSFHREADTKLMQAQVVNANITTKKSSNRARLTTIDEHNHRPSTPTEHSIEVPIVSLDIAQAKAGFRVNVR